MLFYPNMGNLLLAQMLIPFPVSDLVESCTSCMKLEVSDTRRATLMKNHTLIRRVEFSHSYYIETRWTRDCYYPAGIENRILCIEVTIPNEQLNLM
jgi:hypothetical protein